MEYTIKQLNEIIDSNGELIGADNVPKSGPDLETGANNTTDYNQKVSAQPYRYDMMGRFGFTLMPFYEEVTNKNDGNNDSPILNAIAKIYHEKCIKILEYYYKHPNLLKSDYRKKSEETFENDSEECKKNDINFAIEIMKEIEPIYEKAYDDPDKKKKENVTESKIVEDKMYDKRGEDEISTKTESDEIKDKKLVKIAGLISKLPKKDVDKIATLLETNK
jgi:hypothetical protein